MEKHLRIKNQTISYVEKNETKSKTIFFIHGNSGSALSWSKQLNDPLLSDYRLVAFDLPAHGNSSPFKNETKYNLLSLAEFMAEALQACLENDEYIIVGFSLGTNIVAEMLKHNIYPKGIVLISPSIVGEGLPLHAIGLPGFSEEVLFNDDCSDAALQSFINLACFANNNDHYTLLKEDYKKVKAPFRSMLLKTILDGKLSDEIDLLNSYASVPLLLIFGQEEKIVEPGYLDHTQLPVWNNTIYKIAQASHFVHMDQPEATNQLLAGYCRSYLHSFTPMACNS